MLEKMDEFFERRLASYDEHMMNNIYGAKEFYPYTASLLPMAKECHVLDLGCGTGLELEEYLAINPSARITGIDLSDGMLSALREKFDGKDYHINLICTSYFEAPLGESVYDAAVSVESLHHFTKDAKVALYTKLHEALVDGGYFVLTDYFADSEHEEEAAQCELIKLKKEQKIADSEHYHYDTPLTLAHEIEALREAGFSSVVKMNSWGATHTLKAIK